MLYLSERQLREKGSIYKKNLNERSIIIREQKDAQITIFLSHSHKDKDLILGFIAILEEYNVNLYVDWQDSGMPEITNKETAEKIKVKIKELDYFLLLATNNALASRWVPWEVGIADATKEFKKIAIIPITDENGQFQGNEYLQLYQRITFGEGWQLGIFPPGATRGYFLDSWIRSNL